MSGVIKIIVGVALITVAIVGIPFTGGLSFTAYFALAGAFVSIGASLIAQGLTELILGKPRGTAIEAGKVNVRLPEPIRWMNAGNARQGGGVLFADFDSAGNLWYLIVHSDTILNQTLKYYFDDIELTLDGSGNVITNEFCLTPKKESYNGSGTRVPYFQIWTTTYTATNPTPAPIAALMAAFPSQWTSDHKLVGTTYSVIRGKAIGIEDRYKAYKWRGPLGLGEPSITILGQWAVAYDPRDPTQTLGVPSTYKFTRNSELIWAWFRTQPYGRNKSLSSINWARVAEQANVCDETVIGIEGSQPRYTCCLAAPEDKERSAVEQEILMSMDAQLVFDNDGKCWARAGKYYAPTLQLSRNRDIIGMESIEAQNGESETQGVIVRYSEPSAKYVTQPSAPWYNPFYYRAGEAAQFLTVDIPTIDNHNQAMRIGKALGLRSQPSHKLAPTTGLRGLQARQERFVNLLYDNTFAGDYEIFTPVEVDEVGIFCQLGLVPVDPDRFDLLLGEEKAKPVFTDASTSYMPTALSAVTVAINNGRIEVSFTPLTRNDVRYEFQYIATADLSSDKWLSMAVDPVTNFAYSDAIAANVPYLVRWRTLTSSGRPSTWSVPVTTTNTSSLAPTTNLVVTGGVGQNVISWRNSVSPEFSYTKTFRGTSTVFSAATAVGSPLAGGLGQYQGFTDTGLTAGTYYYWNQSFTAANVGATPTGPVQGIVT